MERYEQKTDKKRRKSVEKYIPPLPLLNANRRSVTIEKYKEINEEEIKANLNLWKKPIIASLNIDDEEKLDEIINKQYKNISEEEKRKLEKKLIKEKVEYEKYMELIKNRVYQFPPKPANSFALYIRKNIKKIQEEKDYDNLLSPVENAAKFWSEESDKVKKYYKKRSEMEVTLFKIRLRQFKKLGYYRNDIIVKKEDDDQNDENDGEKKKQKEEDKEGNEERKKIKKRRSNHLGKS